MEEEGAGPPVLLESGPPVSHAPPGPARLVTTDLTLEGAHVVRVDEEDGAISRDRVELPEVSEHYARDALQDSDKGFVGCLL